MSGSREQLSFIEGLDRTTFRLHSRRMMIKLSHVIEEQCAGRLSPTILIATFQRLSLYAVEAPRYRALAPQYAHVYVFGIPDVPVVEIPNVTVVPLDETWPLIEEWSVIAGGPEVSVGLLAVDAEGFRPDRRSRAFNGIFTTDTAVIDTAIARLYAALQMSPPGFERDRRATHRTTEAIRRKLAERT